MNPSQNVNVEFARLVEQIEMISDHVMTQFIEDKLSDHFPSQSAAKCISTCSSETKWLLVGITKFTRWYQLKI